MIFSTVFYLLDRFISRQSLLFKDQRTQTKTNGTLAHWNYCMLKEVCFVSNVMSGDCEYKSNYPQLSRSSSGRLTLGAVLN